MEGLDAGLLPLAPFCLEVQSFLAETWAELCRDLHACSVHERYEGKQAEEVEILCALAHAA